MPVKMDWYNEEKTIYLAEYIGIWTWEEVYQGAARAIKQFDEVDHTVHVIHDFTQTTHFPTHILSHAVTMSRSMHPRTGVGVLVGTGNFFRTLVQIFSSVYALTFRDSTFMTMETVAAAAALLQEKIENSAAKAGTGDDTSHQ